ncbi:MAG: class I SAM-dependent methyltransferase [Candidatus Omnitrophica bacterium]|nr:class I SAM-dependent methyltransferase [Candidatus Omnitrophota bacterium]
MACLICGAKREIQELFSVRAYSQLRVEFKVGFCAVCGVKMVMDPPKDLSLYYENTRMRESGNPFFRLAKNFLLSTEANRIIVGQNEDRSLIDIGCGSGDFSHILSRKGFKVISADAVETVPKLLESTGGDINYIQINFADILNSLPKGKMPRIVVLRHVLEHLIDPVDVLKGFVNAGAEYIYIAVPNHDHILDRLFGKNFCGYDVPRHLWFFGKNSLLKVAERAGLTVLSNGVDTVPMVCASFCRYLYNSSFPSLIVDRFLNGGVINTISFPLDVLIPGNVRWLFMGKFR